jgi:NAD(P)-dependent dehydrogenase (short-subunit alcohol dehydrogenase family)
MKRIALVTGASRGIGLEVVRLLAARGERVHAVCRHASAGLREAAGAGDVVMHESVDVTDAQAVARLASSLAGERLDHVVLNAGVLVPDTLEAVDFEAVRAQLETNAIAPLRCVVALRPRLGRGAKVLLVTSRMGSMGDNTSGGFYGYRMSKAALNAAGVSLARDLGAEGIAVGIVHPGFVRTEMTGGAGHMSAAESAALLVQRLDALDASTSGAFLHASGEPLPW